jgi:hypothetical protein
VAETEAATAFLIILWCIINPLMKVKYDIALSVHEQSGEVSQPVV